MSWIRRCTGLVLVLGLLGACATRPSQQHLDIASKHTIMANPEGRLVDPADHDAPLSDDEADRYLQGVLENLDAYVAANDGKPVPVMFFIHGGLNQTRSSILRAACWTAPIMNDADHLPDPNSCRDPEPPPASIAEHGYYPIFVNWRSWLVSTYLENLLSNRQGERKGRIEGTLTAPLVLFSDLGRAVTRAPLVWWSQVRTGLETYQGTTPPYNRDDAVFQHYRVLRELMLEGDGPQIQISIGEDNGPPGVLGEADAGSDDCARFYNGQAPDGSWLEGAWGFGSAALTLPTKALGSPLVDGFGKPAWDMMNRRTELLRRLPSEFEAFADEHEIYLGRTGALARFLDLFVARFTAEACDTEREGAACERRVADAGQRAEVTIVGHSMGTIVANWMVADYGERLNLAQLVYLAAASKISSFEMLVIPFLASDHGQETQFYNLMLHPRAEVRERNLNFDTQIPDLAPRGSLLVWIDNYLSNPEHFLDRTLGRWDNIVVAPHIFPAKIRDRVHLKAFGIEPWNEHYEYNPEKHGDFTVDPFWKAHYWEPVAGPCQP